jgi:hypothetical protein
MNKVLLPLIAILLATSIYFFSNSRQLRPVRKLKQPVEEENGLDFWVWKERF